uniref:Uncharacterized protein n=1 Tax=Oryza meridionalis TaxID=40149 RepID=A0A0E0EN46_9ORYZ
MAMATYPWHGALPLALPPHEVKVARSNCHELGSQFLNIDLGSKQSTRLDESSRARCFFFLNHELPIDADSQSGYNESPHRDVFVLPVGSPIST